MPRDTWSAINSSPVPDVFVKLNMTEVQSQEVLRAVLIHKPKDPKGHFTLRGVGRDLHAVLTVHHPRFALQRIEVETASASESKPLTAALAPAQIIKGRVTYGDTGEPVPHAPLELMASQGRIGIPAEFETDISRPSA
jgi:hypothetical protein